MFGPENTFVLSKCGTRMQQATVIYLTRGAFFEKTGMLPGHVVFCTDRSGGSAEGLELARLPTPSGFDPHDLRYFGDSGPLVATRKAGKGVTAQLLGLTHLIDDRQDCLLSFYGEGHLGTLGSSAAGALVHFGSNAAPVDRVPGPADERATCESLWRVLSLIHISEPTRPY
eukprot:TRINITY_DN30174_c0_g1_i1.p1 TRINITY_DN30174_c0_g1~~TRINITY_DN30174_c0_g1_i1.p1  ORF type:complete len:171 (-),score=16.24 TRINITY_DN30174_c0_g1_i1:33-545(-)